ncbi:MAG TPA: glycerol kinase GlpK, partial [Bacillota bacterium]
LIWKTVHDGLSEILASPILAGGRVKAIGITNQRETVVVWDRTTGKPIHPAIVWQCRRTAERCQELIRKGYGRKISVKTGLRIDPYFSATKIEWILNQVPGARDKAARGELACGTIDSWLIWKLTGGRVHATDPSNASRTMLFNIHELRWDLELLRLFGIPPAMLPEVKPSASFFGETASSACAGDPIPIAGVLGDQQAALFGQGCFDPGAMKNTYGTGCFLLMNTGPKAYQPQNGLLTSIAWSLNGKVDYVLEGSVFMGGAVIQWLRDELGILTAASDSERMALEVPDTNGVYLVPAFTGLGAPHWDPYARGLIIGLTRGVNRSHLVRAALEAIAYQVREVIESMCRTVKIRPQSLRVDGGAAANNFLLQFQADICNLQIERNNSLELTGIGAAFIAGLTAGFWENTDSLKGLIQLERAFTPGMNATDRQRLCNGWNKAVDRAKSWDKD